MDTRLVEIVPRCSGGKNATRIYKYSKIRTEQLTCGNIRKIFREKNFKRLPNIVDLGDSIAFQYPKKATLILSKTNGRIYGLSDVLKNIDMKYHQHQACILLDVLREYVDGFSFTTYHRKSIVQFLEKAEKVREGSLQ